MLKDFVSVVFVALGFCAASCMQLDRDYSHLPTRGDAYGPTRLPPGAKPLPVPVLHGDSTLFLSAVSVPSGYDWKRDTAIGLAGGSRVIVYRNLIPAFSLDCGYAFRVGTDPDTHHFVGDHFYTEFHTPDSTFITRDGKQSLAYAGAERIVGLLEGADGLHTLGISRSGRGFTYRLDGKVLLDVKSGMPFGSMADCACPRSGALYMDGDRVCFSYWTGSVEGKTLYVVTDARPKRLDSATFPPTVTDVRVRDGSVVATGPCTPGGYVIYRETGISPERSLVNMRDPTFIECPDGSFVIRTYQRTSSSNPWQFVILKDGRMVYRGGEEEEYVFWTARGPVTAAPLKDGCHIFSRGCIDLAGNSVIAACTPSGDGMAPYVIKDGVKYELGDLDGYLTGIAVSPPR